MSGSIDRAVGRVIATMYERIGDDLTVDDLARTAMYSKFHFSRAFRQVTGVSPGRFLAALRFQEAKRLLASTSLSVAEISNQVGYSSLGTFSTRFKSSVGVSPTEYRRFGIRCSSMSWPGDHRHGCGSRPARIQGQVVAATAGNEFGHTAVGLFPEAVPQGLPARFTILTGPGPFVLEDVPEGLWYVLAFGMVSGQANGGPPSQRCGSVGRAGPVKVLPEEEVDPIDVPLRPMQAVDLPVVAAPFVPSPVDVRQVRSDLVAAS